MSINSFIPFYNNDFNPYNSQDLSDDETSNLSQSTESEDSTEISKESVNPSKILVENPNEISSGSSEETDSFDYVSDHEFMAMWLNAKLDFKELQEKYSHLFQNTEIKKKDFTVDVLRDMDIGMDTIVVTSIKDKTHLMTSGVGPSLVVMARAPGFIALCHSSLDYAEDLLNEMRTKLESKGCLRESIKFYIVGGQLPHRDGPAIGDSIEREKEFLALSKTFNIVGVQLNIANGLEENLSVMLSQDEIVWKINH